ncbi:Na+/H+ antiporter subunit E [Aestuariivirga sp.]|uniref:Na+/H+ antiporter subunit E n=1 Tax=Aestuariivirga sp. TaxID=2650926 RepID=UPI003BAC0673
MVPVSHASPSRLRPLLTRAGFCFLFWLMLAGTATKDILPGVIAAFIAAKVSLSLLPPHALSLRAGPALMMFLRFIGQSFGAGLYVARCALDPRMPLFPGMIVFRPRLAAGPRQDAFATLSSLLPGTLPSGPDQGGMAVHCLDVTKPVAAQLSGEEERLMRAFREAP